MIRLVNAQLIISNEIRNDCTEKMFQNLQIINHSLDQVLFKYRESDWTKWCGKKSKYGSNKKNRPCSTHETPIKSKATSGSHVYSDGGVHCTDITIRNSQTKHLQNQTFFFSVLSQSVENPVNHRNIKENLSERRKKTHKMFHRRITMNNEVFFLNEK